MLHLFILFKENPLYCWISLPSVKKRRRNSNRINHTAFLSNCCRFSMWIKVLKKKKTSQDVNFAITSENGNQLTVISTNWLHRLHISSHYVICNWILSEKKKSSTRHNDNDLERFGLLFFFLSRKAAQFAHKSSRSQHKASMYKIKKKNNCLWQWWVLNVSDHQCGGLLFKLHHIDLFYLSVISK